MHALLIFPHQLFRTSKQLDHFENIVLIEEPLYFTQFKFHIHKLILHRDSMKNFEKHLKDKGKKVYYYEHKEIKETENIGNLLKKKKIKSVSFFELVDNWLDKKLRKSLEKNQINFEILKSENFILSNEQCTKYSSDKKSLFFTKFYTKLRKDKNILVDKNKEPIGGKWSFDKENRKKLPKNYAVPQYKANYGDVKESSDYIKKTIKSYYGRAETFWYPTTRKQSLNNFNDFLKNRYQLFGDYEDAISDKELIINHSVLSPSLNISLISPAEIIKKAQDYDVAMNSKEGFIRQVLGWREYMRLVYLQFGSEQRNSNFWQFSNKMPSQFYDGTTGIEPIDNTINKVLNHSYCHHIERLMLIGNFMLLLRIHPNEVYKWFMELFIDAYDWVMVPNVYAMSQYSDGGLITTKPYISASSYVKKMSNYKKGDWCDIWDALYWCFIDDYKEVFKNNYRMSMMIHMLDKLGDKMNIHRKVKDQYFSRLF